MSSAEGYARWVLAEENARRTGRYVKLAAERFLSDLKRKDIYFDEAKAVECQVFCEKYLCLWEDKWRGKPMDFRPWMRFIFEQIFGWIRVDTGLRRFRKAFVEVSKKNAKSTIGAGLVDYHLVADERVSTPSVFIGANNEEQARICLKIAGKILESSPEMADWIKDEDIRLLYNYGEINKIILTPDPARDNREGTVTALSKEGSDKKSKTSGGKHGKNPSLVVVDEYGMAADDNLLNDMESGQAARDEPLLFVITTSGFNKEGPCYAKLRATGIGVLEGTMEDDSYLVIIYEMDPPVGEDGKPGEITVEWLLENEDLWEQSNPNIDVSVRRDFLRARLISARNERGTKEVDVMTLNFNRWMDAPEVWIPTEIFNANTHGLGQPLGRLCYGGFQMSSGKELNAFSLFFPGPIHIVKMQFFLPEDRPADVGVDFSKWASEGHLHICEGNTIENDFMYDKVVDELKKYRCHSISFPSTHDNNEVVQRLIRSGVQCNPIGKNVSAPTFTWEKLMMAKQVEHFGNPVLRYCNSNTMAIRRGDDIRVERIAGKTAGIVACINAVAQWETIEATKKNNQLIESW